MSVPTYPNLMRGGSVDPVYVINPTDFSAMRPGANGCLTGNLLASQTPQLLIDGRATRRSVAIFNLSDTLNVKIGPAGNTLLILTPRATAFIDFTGPLYVVADSGSPLVTFVETYDTPTGG